MRYSEPTYRNLDCVCIACWGWLHYNQLRVYDFLLDDWIHADCQDEEIITYQ